MRAPLDHVPDDSARSDHPPFWRMVGAAACGLSALLMVFALVSLFLWATQARAHAWYTGERDPVTNGLCCDERDCFEIADTDVMQVAGGFVYLPLDNKAGPNDSNPGFIPSKRVKPSATYGYAICLGGGQYSTGSTSTTSPMFIRCFFQPTGF